MPSYMRTIPFKFITVAINSCWTRVTTFKCVTYRISKWKNIIYEKDDDTEITSKSISCLRDAMLIRIIYVIV